jgi:hypothetical protein
MAVSHGFPSRCIEEPVSHGQLVGFLRILKVEAIAIGKITQH